MRLNILQWKTLYKITEEQIKLLLDADSGAYIESQTLCRYYRHWVNNDVITKNSLPPAFKYIDKEDIVVFNYKLWDHQQGIWFLNSDETKYIFHDQNIDIFGQNNHKELYLLNRMRVPFNINNELLFSINDDQTMASYYDHKMNRKTATLGKVLQQVPWLYSKSDSEIEELVNVIKARLDPDIEFKIVSGSEIKHWYLGDNYANNCGSLNASCMRYRRCQDYLNIYAENNIQMLIATDNESKLRGRALLWPREIWNRNYWDNVPYIMDRIYGNDHTITKFKQYAQERGWVYKNRQTYSDTKTWRVPGDYIVEEKRCRMNLDYITFDEYPYVDTFNRIDYDECCLKNYGHGDVLDSTEGYTSERGSCNDCGNSDVHEDDWHWVNDERYCDECVTWSEYDDCYYHNEDVRYSEPLSSYIHYDDAYDITHGDNIGNITHRDNYVTVYNDDDSVVPTTDAWCSSTEPVNFLTSDTVIKFDLISVNGPSMKTFRASDSSNYNKSCWDTFIETMYNVSCSYNNIAGITFEYNDIKMSFVYNDAVWSEIIEVLTTCVEHFNITQENIENYATT